MVLVPDFQDNPVFKRHKGLNPVLWIIRIVILLQFKGAASTIVFLYAIEGLRVLHKTNDVPFRVS